MSFRQNSWLITVAWLLFPLSVRADSSHAPEHWIGGSIGYGMAAATGGDTDATGVLVAGEYAYHLVSFFQLRSYAGVLITSPDTDGCFPAAHCEVVAKIGFIGVKGRVVIPIPYIAPFIELGLGISGGYLKTELFQIHERTRGLAEHIPFTLGVALGEDHNVELAFSYLFHPAEHQFGGGISAGVMFGMGP